MIATWKTALQNKGGCEKLIQSVPENVIDDDSENDRGLREKKQQRIEDFQSSNIEYESQQEWIVIGFPVIVLPRW